LLDGPERVSPGQTRHRLLSGSTAVLAACLISAPAARADDASLFGAYNARQGDVNAASAKYVRALKRNHRHPNNKTLRAIVVADRGINRVLTAIKADLAAQSASSSHGRKARACAFREVRWWRRANNMEIHGIKLLIHGHDAAANDTFDRATRTVRRAYKQGRIAVRHFKAVGLKSSLGPISAK
jgi:hypothetical protein